MLSLKDLPRRFIILDLECTTWDGAAARGWSGPNEHREVVQLGATLTEVDGFPELFPFVTLVKPAINPVLSKYFIKLTHIRRKAVDRNGLDFPTFLQMFSAWCGDYEIYSFDSRVDGSRMFDRDVLMENCELLGIKFPFEKERFHNINEIFAYHGYTIKQSGASPEAFGLKVPARPHNALNDVRGLLISLKALSERV